VRVLVVDDEPAARRALARALLARGFAVDTAESGSAALDLLRTRPTDAVLLDHEMPELDGLATLAQIRRRNPDVEVVLLIPLGDLAVMAAALRGGAFATLATPLPAPEAAIPLIERAAERRRLSTRVRALEEQVAEHEQLGPIVVGSARMNELLRRAAAAAASSAPVLVIGEPGTGRASLARFVHRRSSRARAPFVVWSAAAVATGGPGPSEEAASTGLGVALAEAEGGTLVLADLGLLPPSAQACLASALARQEPSRPRVVATAEPSVRDQVARGVLREDVFYRLAAVLLEVPPLRRRREDIPLLAYHFLSRYAAREGKTIRRVSPDALRALREHAWPGNVRELENAIEYAAVMARGDAILRADLPLARPEVDDDAEVLPVALAGSDVLELPYGEAKERAVAAFDVAYVERRMKRTAGNVSEAARLAGMDRSNFRRLLKKVREQKRRRVK
jgi:DNA-binding NtrC family response regulator